MQGVLQADLSIDGGVDIEQRKRQLNDYLTKLNLLATKASDFTSVGGAGDDSGEQRARVSAFQGVYRLCEVMKKSTTNAEEQEREGEGGHKGEGEHKGESETVRAAREAVQRAHDLYNEALERTKFASEAKKTLGSKVCDDDGISYCYLLLRGGAGSIWHCIHIRFTHTHIYVCTNS